MKTKKIDKIYNTFFADDYLLYVQIEHFENLFNVCLKQDANEFLRLLDTDIRDLVKKHNKIVNKMSSLNKKEFIKALRSIDDIFALVELKLETYNKLLLDSRRIKTQAA